MKPLRKRLTYANVMSTIAVFLVVAGGTAFAANQLAKNSVGTKQLKNNAVTGAKVKNGSLTGADLNASTLGTVPKATEATRAASSVRADSATNADSANRAAIAGDAEKLGGQLPSAFQPAGSVQRIDFDVSGCGAGGCTVPLIKANSIVLDGFCTSLLGGEVAVIASAPAGTTIWQLGKFSSGSGVFQEEFSIPPTPFPVLAFGGSTAYYTGQIILRSATHTLTLDIAASQNGAGTCRIAGNALSV